MSNEVALLTANRIATEDLKFLVKPLHDGNQILFRFPNGYGVSVVRHSYSYGGNSGLFEAAPIIYNDSSFDNWEFVGMSLALPGFANRDDVSGWLTPEDVDEILTMVSQL